MDPLSIVASSTALLMTCGKATLLLHNFISSTKEVHSTITTLHADITSLSELLQDLKVLFGKREIRDVIDVGMDNIHGRVWKRAEGILESVGLTVGAIEALILKIEGKGGKVKEKENVGDMKKKGAVKGGWMQLKMEFRAGDFELRHRQLQTQRFTLQIFLASITLCIQIHAENEQSIATDNILASIDALKQDVKSLDTVGIRGRFEDSAMGNPPPYLLGRSDGPVNHTGMAPLSTAEENELDHAFQTNLDLSPRRLESENEIVLANLEDTIDSAKDVIHSAQASIASRQEGSTRSNHSVAVSDRGSLFNLVSRQRVGDWVSGNVIEEEESDSENESESAEFDIEAVISERLQEQGDQHLELGKFAEAEEVYGMAMRHYQKANIKTEDHRSALSLRLAISRARQQKWKDIEELSQLQSLSPIVETKSLDILTGWHLIAEHKLLLGSLKDADDICRKVTSRRRELLRKRDPLHEESLQLLIQITQAKSVKLKEKGEELLVHGIRVHDPLFDCNHEIRGAALENQLSLVELLLSLPDVEIDSICEDGLSAIAYPFAARNHEICDLLK